MAELKQSQRRASVPVEYAETYVVTIYCYDYSSVKTYSAASKPKSTSVIIVDETVTENAPSRPGVVQPPELPSWISKAHELGVFLSQPKEIDSDSETGSVKHEDDELANIKLFARGAVNFPIPKPDDDEAEVQDEHGAVYRKLKNLRDEPVAEEEPDTEAVQMNDSFNKKLQEIVSSATSYTHVKEALELASPRRGEAYKTSEADDEGGDVMGKDSLALPERYKALLLTRWEFCTKKRLQCLHDKMQVFIATFTI